MRVRVSTSQRVVPVPRSPDGVAASARAEHTRSVAAEGKTPCARVVDHRSPDRLERLRVAYQNPPVEIEGHELAGGRESGVEGGVVVDRAEVDHVFPCLGIPECRVAPPVGRDQAGPVGVEVGLPFGADEALAVLDDRAGVDVEHVQLFKGLSDQQASLEVVRADLDGAEREPYARVGQGLLVPQRNVGRLAWRDIQQPEHLVLPSTLQGGINVVVTRRELHWLGARLTRVPDDRAARCEGRPS